MSFLREDLLPTELSTAQQIVFENVWNQFKNGIPSNASSYVDSDTRNLCPRPAQDIDGCTDLILRIIEEQQIQDSTPDHLKVKFVEDFNPKDVQTEVISFGLLRREPGPFGRGGPFASKVSEYKPHIRGINADPKRPGYCIATLGQKFENEILITCWAKTNKRANWRARWLEDTLKSWTWYIRYNGIDDFFFLQQLEDIVLPTGHEENRLMGRPLKYYVRTERLTHILEPTIRRIIVKYGIGDNGV